MKTISRKSAHCWYELGWDEENKAIILRIHKDYMEAFPEIPADVPIVKSLSEEFEIETFSGDLSGDIGFGGRLKQRNKDDEFNEFVEFSISLLTIKKEDGDCPICKTSGVDSLFSTEECRHCGGSGKRYSTDRKSAFSISATFNVIFKYLSLFEFDSKETMCSLPQLMIVYVSPKTDIYDGLIGGTFSIDLVNWMSSFPIPYTIEEMVSAMKDVYGIIFGDKPDKFRRFKASIDHKNGRLNINCPGQACGLNPSYSQIGKKDGYDFIPHNIDTPLQPLILLAGLAALHDKARKEM